MASEEDVKVAREIILDGFGSPEFIDPIRESIATALTAARAEGEASMRERAAEVADKRAERSAANAQRYELKNTDAHTRACSRADEAESIADEIRALEAAAGSKTKVFSREDEQKNQGR